AGAPATSASASAPRTPASPCPANGPCGAGSAACKRRPRRRGPGPRQTAAGPCSRMRSGKWMRPTSSSCAAGWGPVGSAWSMRGRGPSYRRPFSPLKYWAHVLDVAVQEQLRAGFTRWGRPRRLGVDNGKPWGSWRALPTALALWLIGLGIEMLWNPPRRPQANGVVERSQGTAKRWGDPGSCASVAQLQRELDEADRLQRERYPLVQGRSRWDLYPGLQHSGRPYTARHEPEQWQLE